MASPWPFAVWGINLIDQLPKGRCSVQYAVVAINYFTKWVEAEALVSITSAKIKEFIYKNIVCWYEIPYTIVSDNETQFDCNEFKEFCEDPLLLSYQYALIVIKLPFNCVFGYDIW